MKRTIPIAAFVVVALVGAFAATAAAYPSKTTSCQTCHSGTTLAVTATQTSNDGTTAGYTVTAPGCDYIAVFDGATKYSQITSQTTTITVPAGRTYVLQAVKGPGTTTGFGQASISPTATVVDIIATDTVDTTRAVTVCETGDASVKLTATDNPDGWGVAYIYYQLDGVWTHLVRVPANNRAYQTTVPVPAPASGSKEHTIKFWSQDNYGNVEAATTKTFTVTAPVVGAKTTGLTLVAGATSLQLGKYVGLSSTLSGGVPAGTAVRFEVKRPGTQVYVLLSSRSVTASGASGYRYKLTQHGTYYFRAVFAGTAAFKASSTGSRKVYVH